VILLVGAFEFRWTTGSAASRADGVLGKSRLSARSADFMVKYRVGARRSAHGESSVARRRNRTSEGTDLFPLACPPPPVSALQPGAPIAAVADESFCRRSCGASEPVRIDARSQPVAFGACWKHRQNEKERFWRTRTGDPGIGAGAGLARAAGGEDLKEGRREEATARLAARRNGDVSPTRNASSLNWRSGGISKRFSRGKRR